jgi:DNA polymerase-3 subunit alpha
MSFVNLFVETNFSMNGSNIKIKELINKAVEYNYSSLAITDDKMYGIIKFYKECLKNNVKPIIGLNVMIEGIDSNTNSRLLLYAKNNQGYQSLLKLSSLHSINGILTIKELKKHNKDLVFCLNTNKSELITYFANNQINEMNEALNLLTNLTEDLFFGVSANKELNELLDKKYKLIVLDYVHYQNEDDYIVSNTLKKIFSKDSNDLFSDNIGFHFKTPEEINDIYKDYPKAIENTQVVSDLCNVEISFDKTYLPKYNIKQDVSSKDYLHALAYKGLDKRLLGLKVNKKTYIDRLKYELKVIDDMGYNDYFLIVWDFSQCRLIVRSLSSRLKLSNSGFPLLNATKPSNVYFSFICFTFS